METKQFKAESKRLLDLMINSIYTNKEIFLRELISNASDAMDKLYYNSLTDKNININKDNLTIKINADKQKRTLTIEDKGIGMNAEELENNLGTIAQSGSFAFKNENEKKDDVNIIGQFGVGFYSAFMVSKEVEVISKPYGAEKAYIWKSKGAEGYTIEETTKEDFGTTIILHIKEDSEEEKYSEFLDEYRIKGIVKRYSDYIRYPIKMDVTKKELKQGSKDEYEEKTITETLNSMIPIWKKKKSEVTDEEFNSFYTSKFGEFETPIKVIRSTVEGTLNYDLLLYIPSNVPYNYYTKEFEKGLQLYSNGVLIMEKCKDLLPDYFSFVKGLVDSPDLSLNISREILQQDRQLKTIAKNIEKKIKSELEDMLNKNREEYEKFFKTFGIQLKFGVYNNFGIDKDKLKDLLMFYSSTEKKLVTLKEYVTRMKEGQDKIYYACGETVNKIDMLPQVEGVKDKEYEILYLTDEIDEFVLQVLINYEEKEFANVSANNLNLDSKEDKEKLEKLNEECKDMLSLMQETIPEVAKVCFTNRLKEHPVCLTTEGAISVEMQKVINALPNNKTIQAKTLLEINENHAIANKLKSLYESDKEELKKYTKILYAQAKLIEGLNIDNPTEISNLICEMISK
ncbi:MAG: molecular chaperone HtpG [Clostridia bacterium]|nr:molecular chaperone HtpG [Clostridia bacterium]